MEKCNCGPIFGNLAFAVIFTVFAIHIQLGDYFSKRTIVIKCLSVCKEAEGMEFHTEYFAKKSPKEMQPFLP